MSVLTSSSSVRCPICGAAARTVYTGYPGYQEPSRFDLGACDACNTGFVLDTAVDTRPIYEAIYGAAEVVPGYNRYVRYARDILAVDDPLGWLATQEVSYWGIRQHVMSAGLHANDAIVEVGSGLGYLTYALNKSGRPTIGVDISREAVDQATRVFGNSYVHMDLAHYAAQRAGQCRLVIGTEVIEHVPDVYAFLEAGIALLQPGGELLVTTPNRDACSQDIAWDVEAPPVHLWWFSARSFEAMAEKLGCQVRLVDLGSYPQHDTWRQRVLGRNGMPLNQPVLDRHGNVIRHRPLQPRALRAASKILRSAISRIRRVIRFGQRAVTDRSLSPAPALCVIFEKASAHELNHPGMTESST